MFLKENGGQGSSRKIFNSLIFFFLKNTKKTSITLAKIDLIIETTGFEKQFSPQLVVWLAKLWFGSGAAHYILHQTKHIWAFYK